MDKKTQEIVEMNIDEERMDENWRKYRDVTKCTSKKLLAVSVLCYPPNIVSI